MISQNDITNRGVWVSRSRESHNFETAFNRLPLGYKTYIQISYRNNMVNGPYRGDNKLGLSHAISANTFKKGAQNQPIFRLDCDQRLFLQLELIIQPP